ncbi:MAG: NAD(P)H-hydrate dehydratase [Calditrichaeota bacterium]|nr:NAD(P)H-hydrate dehydratase [Calditrichota bacterium]
MYPVVTAGEMRRIDQLTIESIGIPGIVLMERAGQFTSFVIRDLLKEVEAPLVVIFCGKGNNGGDGLVVARYLHVANIEVKVVCLADPEDFTGDALTNLEIIQNLDVPLDFVSSMTQLRGLVAAEGLDEADVVVDAILGTGIRGPVKGFLKNAIEFINDIFLCPIVAVDIPSGLIADNTDVTDVCIGADITVTMGLPKYCHVVHPARMACGEVKIADIGIPPEVFENQTSSTYLLRPEDFFPPPRFEADNKYTVGKVAVLAGSPGYTGAATLTAQAAAKIGAGLVILGIPESLNPILEQKLTEVITRPLPETPEHTIGKVSLSAIGELLDWCDVLIIGPGLGRSHEVQETILELLTGFNKLAVIDADALYALAMHPDFFRDYANPSWVLTPHDGEFLRFLPDVGKDQLFRQRIDLARQFAKNHNVVLNLKSATSLTAAPNGDVLINGTGNSALAKGGTGDVLSGFIGGIICQMHTKNLLWTTAMANLLHGYIADYYVQKNQAITMMASDLLVYLDEALNAMLKEKPAEQ